MNSLTYIFYNLVYKPILKIYLKTDSNITFDGFKLKIFKDVFHPKLFFSTKYFYAFIKEQDLAGLKFLEIGSGSGILSLLAHKQGAAVTAIDIDEKAVENTGFNFSKNFKENKNVSVLKSDLFSGLPKEEYDFIVINPPYYFKKVEADRQYAWNCGANGEYFEKLFREISNYTHSKTNVYMILGDNCEIDRIRSMASKNKIDFELVNERQIKWEKNYIFKLKVNP